MRYATSADRRAKACARARRRRDEIEARRLVDPEFDALIRARIRLHSKDQRRQRRRRNLPAAPPSGPELPALPLAVFIALEILDRRRELNGHASHVPVEEIVCESLGVDERSFHRWANDHGVVRFDMVDRVVVNSNVDYTDIYSSAVLRRTARLRELMLT
jgi:hypothetical protein